MLEYGTIFEIICGALSIIVSVGFAVMIGRMIYYTFKAYKPEMRDIELPILTVEAAILEKHHEIQTDLSKEDQSRPEYQEYCILFEVESGGRLEFNVPYRAYRRYVEGDSGKLTFQGNEFLGFEP